MIIINTLLWSSNVWLRSELKQGQTVRKLQIVTFWDIYIYIERERERERDIAASSVCIASENGNRFMFRYLFELICLCKNLTLPGA